MWQEIKEWLGWGEDDDPMIAYSDIAEAYEAGEIDEDEAQALVEDIYPEMDPNDDDDDY